MKYVIFTEKLKSNQLNMLKKFTEVMIKGLLENDSIYIDDIGTFYAKKTDGSSNNNPVSTDEVSLFFMPNKVKNTKRFKEIKNAPKCMEITKIISKLLKDNIILDVSEFGIFKSTNEEIKFTQNKLFKKKLNEEINSKLSITTNKALYLKSEKEIPETQNKNDVVEYLNNDDEHIDNSALDKIKDYEDLEEIVYDDYVNKRDYSKLNNNKKVFTAKQEDKINIIEKAEQKEVENNTTRSVFKENVEKTLDNSKNKKIANKMLVSKIFIIVSSIIVIVISSGIITHLIVNNVKKETSKIDVNQSVYSIVDSFFNTYKSTTLSMKLTQDMYLWDISEELYDSPLYWPMIYGANIIVSNPAIKIPKGTIITYRDLRLRGKYLFNIAHRTRFEQTLSRSYIALYPILLDYNESVHALWALRLSSYFNSRTFKSYKNTINKDLYDRIIEDTKNYAKRSI